ASRRGGRVRVERTAVACRSTPVDPTAPADWSARQEIETALAVAGRPKASRSAASVSMSLCDLAAGRATPDEESFVSSQWHADLSSAEGWYTFAAPLSVADRVCRDLGKAGLTCKSLDGMTHALARAVWLAGLNQGGRTVAALDWSHGGAMLCSVSDGRPVYVRQLRGCGLAKVEEAVAEELQLERLRVCELISSLATKPADDPAAELVREIARPVTEDLASELARTLDHLRSHKKALAPESVALFGGGAALGVHRRLAERAKLPVAPWTLPTDGDAPPPAALAMFGPAIALSALAWGGS
ncbi:MAG: hypothetical protein AAGJ46_21850, partial [Planctomycetota bacterium]